jgi:coproporphyrinogen III oxidase-like Fe-S oxidoreductase
VVNRCDEAAYLAALVADLEAALPQVWNRPVSSIFIGGGTPSLMRGETAEALLAAIRMRLPLHPGAEITLEANPGTAEAAKFAAFRAAGVTRLSIGVQSFDDAKLAALGRIHNGAEARRAIETGAGQFRARQSRPDVCVAGADAGTGRSRHRHGERQRASATSRPIT